jgi:hypothetical protein
MTKPRRHSKVHLNLHAGEIVVIRSREEILATLDDLGRLDNLPFMPEMLRYCGQRARVHKSAHKTCDTIEFSGARKLQHTVHLEGLRCDGMFHGGCQARCMLFWREAWLRRADEGDSHRAVSVAGDSSVPEPMNERLLRATRRENATDPPPAPGEEIYSCQATELNRASEALAWWDVRQYVKDVWTGNVGIGRIIGALGFRIFRKIMAVRGRRVLLPTYDAIQAMRGGIPYPFKFGSCDSTPAAKLDLKPGDRVTVRSQADILSTVNRRNRNRGLSFDEEMVEFCGRTYTVLQRVERIINERTGKMMRLRNDCIMLDGVTCQSRFKDKRLFCPRSIYPYWREIWLKKAEPAERTPDAGRSLR